MKSRINYLLLSVMLVIGIAGCGKDTPKVPDNSKSTDKEVAPPKKTINKDGANFVVKTMEINATDFQKWVYFSFETGKVVDVKEPQHDLSWDLAFRRTFTRTNSGTSGMGQGGAAETPFKSMKDIELRFLNTNPYTIDAMDNIPVEFDQGGNGTMRSVSVNSKIKGVYIADMTQMPPKIGYSDIIYFIKTAKGDYAAFKVLNYEKEIDPTRPQKRGYLTFEYVYPLKKK